uniref:Uncharacterized protein n=1 Tax=Strongyloides papillosus TaxID=174720 RepID=A0A0N5C4P1_STREA
MKVNKIDLHNLLANLIDEKSRTVAEFKMAYHSNLCEIKNGNFEKLNLLIRDFAYHLNVVGHLEMPITMDLTRCIGKFFCQQLQLGDINVTNENLVKLNNLIKNLKRREVKPLKQLKESFLMRKKMKFEEEDDEQILKNICERKYEGLAEILTKIKSKRINFNNLEMLKKVLMYDNDLFVVLDNLFMPFNIIKKFLQKVMSFVYTLSEQDFMGELTYIRFMLMNSRSKDFDDSFYVEEYITSTDALYILKKEGKFSIHCREEEIFLCNNLEEALYLLTILKGYFKVHVAKIHTRIIELFFIEANLNSEEVKGENQNYLVCVMELYDLVTGRSSDNNNNVITKY